MAGQDEINIELAFATPARQVLLKLIVPAQTTVAEAIERSGIATLFADEKIAQLPAGVWGRPVGRQHRLENGDRVELYRPLAIEPREARRLRAKP